MNEASTIIQSAAHEDANIIFGAVLDEKMKDEVKITVIATGFKAVSRRHEASNPVAEVVHQARATAASVHATYEVPTMRGPQAAPEKAAPARSEAVKPSEPEPQRAVERPRTIPYIPDNLDDIDSEIVRHAEPMDEAQVQARAAAVGRDEPPTIETVSSSVNISYDADDLEIPAFLRKRGEG